MNKKKKYFYKLITPKWWNPFFWVTFIIIILMHSFIEGVPETLRGAKSILKQLKK